jgi:transposase
VITPAAGARGLLAARPVDFRKGAHSLAALAAEVLGADPFSGAVLVFRSRRADRVKILVWDGSGLVLVWKQLEGRAFRWPPVVDGVVRLTAGNCRNFRVWGRTMLLKEPSYAATQTARHPG